MAGTIRPGLGDVYNANRPALNGNRTTGEKADAFNSYLKSLPFCKFSSISPEVAKNIVELIGPEFDFLKEGVRNRNLLQIFNGYYLADAATQGIVRPLFKRAFGIAINDACMFDTFAANMYVTEHQDEASKQISAYKAKLVKDGKGNPVPLPEVDPDNLYFADSFLLNRQKEKNIGRGILNFIDQDAAEIALYDNLKNIVDPRLANHETVDSTEFREIVSILHKSKDIHKLLSYLDLRTLTDDQHAYLVKNGLMSINANQNENNERVAIKKVYGLLHDLQEPARTEADRVNIIDTLHSEISVLASQSPISDIL